MVGNVFALFLRRESHLPRLPGGVNRLCKNTLFAHSSGASQQDRQTDRQRHRQTYKQTDRQTYRRNAISVVECLLHNE